jgi:hypothetical protein
MDAKFLNSTEKDTTNLTGVNIFAHDQLTVE